MAVVVLAALGYFVLTYLSPPQAAEEPGTALKEANIAPVAGTQFSSLTEPVALPITADSVGWPDPFQSIYDRGLPGVYVNKNANAPQ